MDFDATRCMLYMILIIDITCECWIGNDGVASPDEWLASNIPTGEVIGFDPNLISHATYLKYSKVIFFCE